MKNRDKAVKELRERTRLTNYEITKALKAYLKRFPNHEGYPLRRAVANAQIDKVLKDPDLALINGIEEVPVCCSECQCQGLFSKIRKVIPLAGEVGNDKSIV